MSESGPSSNTPTAVSSSDEDAKKSRRRVIMVPVDGSLHAERAFSWYRDNLMTGGCANGAGDQLIFIHVIQPVYSAPPIGMMAASTAVYGDLNQLMDAEIENGRTLMNHFLHMAKSCATAGKPTAQAFLVIDNDPGHALVKSVEQYRPDMIVMGNRGLGKIRRTFMGSVSDHVLHHAHVPVVVVPPSSAQQDCLVDQHQRHQKDH